MHRLALVTPTKQAGQIMVQQQLIEKRVTIQIGMANVPRLQKLDKGDYKWEDIQCVILLDSETYPKIFHCF